MPTNIKNIIKKYGNYADVLKNGSTEEKNIVSNYISNGIHEMQERGVCD